MSERTIGPSQDVSDKRVYVGALIPMKHYALLVEEAIQASVSRSEVLRWALTERYGGVHPPDSCRPLHVAGEKEKGT